MLINVADRAALPRVRFGRDGALHLIHPAGLTRSEGRVRQRPPRTRRPVHLGAGGGDHVVGQEPVLRVVRRGAAQQRDLSVGVEEYLLEPGRVLEVFECLRLAGERGIGLALHGAQVDQTRETGVVTQEMGVHIDDEVAAQPGRSRFRRGWIGRFGARHGEHRAVDLIHGEKAGRHPRCGLEEPPPRQAVLAAEFIGQGFQAGLDLGLRLRLRHGRELVAGD